MNENLSHVKLILDAISGKTFLVDLMPDVLEAFAGLHSGLPDAIPGKVPEIDDEAKAAVVINTLRQFIATTVSNYQARRDGLAAEKTARERVKQNFDIGGEVIVKPADPVKP